MTAAVVADSSGQGEVDALRAELAALRSSLVADEVSALASWPLSPVERRIFAMLLAQDVVSKRTIVMLLRDRQATPADLKNVDVFMGRIRSKTAALGVRIETIFAVGYRLEGRESWRETIGRGAPARH